MNKNWYIIYSKPQFEKKIVAACNKKKIENYFPLKQVNKHSTKKERGIYEPLFLSLIFVKTTLEEMNEIRRIDGVVSMMFWQDRLATVKEEEIDAIKEFTRIYGNIQVEPSVVNTDDVVRNVTVPIKSVDGKVYSISCKTVKVNLPSLGFLLSAEVNNTYTFAPNELEVRSNVLSQH